MAKKRNKLGEILVEWDVINETAVKVALKHAQEHGKRIGEALVELELCEEDDVIKALATQFGLEYVDLDHHAVDRDILTLIPSKLIEDFSVLPFVEEGQSFGSRSVRRMP